MDTATFSTASVGRTERATASLIAALPAAPPAFKACALACLSLRGGAMVMTLPGGRALHFGDPGDGRTVLMTVHDYRFAKRVLSQGDIGFAEGFMAGEWDTPHLSDLLTFLADNAERISRVFRGSLVGRLTNMVRHLSRENTRSGSRRNILDHYDLGNAFYSVWLDPTMTYSSARFDLSPGTDLEAAQLAKYRALAQALDLQPGDRVLEIGCGWGGFAQVAAGEFGAHVTGLTISDAQFAFATERMAKAGLAANVDIRLQDYRDVTGTFDKVASIEMFEAVGERYWQAYFGKIAEVLRPGGRAGLQIITIADELFDTYRRRADFIQRYVFPGGMLASVTRLKEETASAGLSWSGMDAFGPSYARTLAEWSRRFVARWDDLRGQGFDERFKRLWRFYLSYCEAGFRTGRTDVVQVSLSKA
jgi:cyclopropane-fatty-acyl-phospholipid synthase